MGDRCYMSVTCRREDKARFEELGFVLEIESSTTSLVIEMVDEQANYAHCDKMPANIPYYGINGAGSDYNAGNIACDGKKYAEVETGQSGGFIVDWDYQKMKPRPQSLKRIRNYISVDKRARAILKKLRQKEPHKHLFSPHTNLCHHCGIHADEDLVENLPCTK